MRWKAVLWSMVLVAVFYVGLLAATDIGAALAAAARLTWPWWLVVLTLSLVNYLLRFVRWDLYLRHAGHHLPVLQHLTIYLAGFALTTTPAKAGEAVRALYLRPYGVSLRRSIATVYAERLCDALTMALLALLIYRLPAPVHQWLALGAGAVVLGLLLLQRPLVLQRLRALSRRLSWHRLRRAAEETLGCMADAGTLLKGRLLVPGVGLGVVSWLAEAVGFYVILRELQVPIELPAAVGIYAAAMLAGALSFVPGGLGGTEVVMASLLILGGAPPPTAVAATTITRVATLWFAVVLGVLALGASEAVLGRRVLDEGARESTGGT